MYEARIALTNNPVMMGPVTTELVRGNLFDRSFCGILEIEHLLCHLARYQLTPS